MEDNKRPIQPLPPQVAAQIRSSTSIPTLASVVLGLIENSLDAEARKIDINVDFDRGAVTVEDDGVGIPPKEFTDCGGLGKLHHTSKNYSHSKTLGRSGTFLASVGALSILTITSHHFNHLQHASVILHHSRWAARLDPAPSHLHLSNRDHGTRVTVQNLFGSMPVRVKQRAMQRASGDDDKHIETLKKQVVALLLAWHTSVTVVLTSNQNKKVLRVRGKRDAKSTCGKDERASGPLDLSLVCSIFSHVGYIDPSDWGDWIKTSARTPLVTIKGAISLKAAPSKNVQFFSLGLRPINAETGSNILYEEVNRLFASSRFGNQEETSDAEELIKVKRRTDGRFKKDGFTNKQLRGGGKGIDRWPMFYIRVELQGANPGHEDDVAQLGESTLTGLIKVLGAMITGFLDENHFRPRARHRTRKQPEMQTPGVSMMPEVQNTVTKSASVQRIGKGQGNDAFGKWSRIKSGIQVKSSGNPSSLSSPVSQYTLPTSNSIVARNLQSDSNVASAAGNIDETGGKEDPTNPLEETIIEWRNPISGASVLVNARTGLVVQKRPSTRPATAPPRLTLPNVTIGHTNAFYNAVSRVTRTTSSMAGLTKAGSWSSDLLNRWENPVFNVAEEPIPHVSLDGPSLETSDILHGRRHCCSDLEIQKAFTQSSSSFTAKLSRRALKNARIIAQVDKKFILVSLSISPSINDQTRGTQLLVLIDQHAADERIRVENLFADLESRPSVLTKPIIFEIPDREQALLARHSHYFADWGIRYDLQKPANSSKCRLTAKALPKPIAERCRIEPKVLIDLLRGEAWKREELGVRPKTFNQTSNLETADKEDWLSRISTCPQGLVDMLNSRACRSAIMFNDQLTMDECRTLVQRLGGCSFPFQCAHGRPSMVPLVEMGTPVRFGSGGEGCGDEAFGRAWAVRKMEGPGEGVSDETRAVA